MEVFKRADGRSPWWQVDFIHPLSGKRIRTSLKCRGTKVEAQKAALKLIEECATKPAGVEAPVTLQDALEAYCTALHSEQKASADGSGALMAKCLGIARPQRGLAGRLAGGPLGLPPGDPPGRLQGPQAPAGASRDSARRFHLDGSMPLKSLTPAILAQLVAKRRAEGNGPQTIAHELKLLRAATRHAAAMGAEVNLNMVNGVLKDAWRLPKLPNKTRYLSVAEFRWVYEYMAPDRPVDGRPVASSSLLYRQRQDARDLLVALVMCGGRWSEVSGLLWSRIDLNQGVIRIWGNKSNKERLVGIPAMMLEMLQRRAEQRRPGQSLVFPTTTGKARAGSCRVISRAIQACGLNDAALVAENGRATVHSLRHTYASLLLQNGATLADIQDALGHTSLAMTRRYAHLAKGESASKLAGIMSGVLA
jgi:integrase